MATATGGRRITRDDLEAAFAKVVGEGEATAQASAPAGLVVAGAVVLGVLTLAYLTGRRRGRRRSAIVEVRRL